MPYASRLANLKSEGAYAVMARAQALEAQGHQIIHLEIGQPDFDTFPHIVEEGVRALRAGFTRYNPPLGIPELRQVIASHAGDQRGMDINPDQVVIGPGAKPGLFFPTLALIEPGDEVIYPDPGFPTYPAMIEVAGGIPVPVPLREENEFSFDLSAFDDLLNDRTRMIILNSPANPTGGIIPQRDLEHIAQAALERQIWIISDEIYARLVYDGQKVPSIASLPGMAERTVIVDGFSKTYAMTGWRLGFAIMPVSLAQQVDLLLTHSIGCTATFTQIAGLHALNANQELADRMVAEYQQKRDRIVDGLNTIAGVHCRVPQGAFYVFPNVKSFNIPADQIASRLLEEAGVAVLPGTAFGGNGEGYLRLCYATSNENIERALENMSAVLN
jgi:aspartate/methionine/tyrosine aminotransferase